MENLTNSIPLIQRAKHGGQLHFSNHALLRMFEKSIRVEHIEQVLDCPSVEIIENYPHTGREQPECLILGADGDGRFIHVIVAYPIVEVVTTYQPSLPKWKTPRQRG